MQLNEIKHDAKKNEPKREFAFSQEFPNEIELALKAFDRVFKELTSISNWKIEFSEEYGVVNNLYKFRYITPSDIATYTSNLIKVLKNRMICPHVTDLQKFSVVCAKQYVEDHGCVPIEHSSIYGLYNYTTDNMTLRDLLVLCENDFYHTTVVSRFEMQERVKVMKEDYKKIADMHFNTNIMKIVDSLPKLITQTDFLELTYVEQKAVQTFIEEFILFTIMLNTIIMSNMIFFCVPKSTYDTKFIEKKEHVDSNTLLDDADMDDGGLYTEAVDTSKYKPVYIVLMSGNGAISKAVQKTTLSAISHAGISFDSSMNRIYSFGMFNKNRTEEAPRKNGFRIDSFFTENHKDVTMSVYAGYMSNENYNKMKSFVEDNYVGDKKTDYSLGTIWKQLWHSDKEPRNPKEMAFVCSTFVDRVLKEAGVDVTGKHLPSPHDFDRSMANDMVHFERVFNGKPEHFDEQDMLDRVKNFAKYKKTNNADDVVTEAVDTSKTKPIYVVLTEGVEFVSDQVKRHTRSRYSHSGLSFDDSLHHVYSFGLQNPVNEDTIVRNGFRMDDMFSDHHKGIRFTVFVAFVSNDKWNTMKKYADHVKNSPKSKYSLGIIWRQLWNDEKPHKSDTAPDHELKEVCSTFVNSILKSADIDLTKKVLPAPADFEANMLVRMNQFNQVFSGTSDQFKMDEFRSRVKDFAKREETKKLAKGDVITECCLLKTNRSRHFNKIPFDINMRNIVLQDMHPKFKDTVAAIEYITKDTRSPFAQLIYRYGSPSKVLDGMDGMMICRMFINDPCARCGCYDEYENQLHQADFHTDVCWLDRIAFGNNFQDGNYRTDALGLEHRHPIKQTLETLYHMFSETRLKTKEELCNHILKIAHVMKGIIDCYGSNGLYNWELVRDILAVLGEIMTRSMIKLYDRHMVLVVSDNMDDVDAPGYMYTEAFVLDEVDMEADEHEPKVVETGNDGKPTGGGNGQVTSAQAEQKKNWCKQMLDKFTKWVQGTMTKVAEKFKGNYKAQVDYVAANKVMNEQIKTDLGNGSFKPKVEDWPKYNIPIKEIGQKKLSEVIKPWLDGTAKEPLAAINVKKAFYPEAVAAVITESYVLESGQSPQIQAPQAQPANVGKAALAAKNVKANANALLQSKIDAPKKFEPDSENGKKLQNFFLFGKPDASNDNYSNELTPELWEDTINNILNCDKAVSVGIKEITADIKSTSDELKSKLAALKEANANAGEAQGDATNANNAGNADITRVEDLIKIVTEISNEYGIGFASSMQNAFFVTSYKLYSDIIKKYKDASGSFEQQQPNANAQPAQKPASAAPAQPAANAQAQPA